MGSKTSLYKPVDNNYEYNSITTVNNNSSHRVYFTDESFDSFTLIWLDRQTKENNLESLQTKNLLLEINKDCLFYENCDLFFNDIDQRKFIDKKILLIVSGSYIKTVLSKENINQIISAIIIFCRYSYKYVNLKKNIFIVDICTDHQSYTCDKALNWYTRETFSYRLVNFAFRTEDITLWYIFRFYITDLCIQLEKIHQEQEKSGHRHLTLYRGQPKLSTKELSVIKSKQGGLVATTGFFPTSYNRDAVMTFVSDVPTTDAYQPVQNQPATLAESERELLFNIGSVFKVTNVYYDLERNLWIIIMVGTDEGTNLIQKQIKPILEKFQIQNQNLLFGKHILDMGYYTAAESYFQRMLQELPVNHKDIAVVYDFIGDMNMRITNWNEAIKNFNHAYLLKKKKYRQTNHRDFGITLNNIGNYHKVIENHDLALDFYRKSLKCVTDSFNVAITNLNIATILKNKKEYSQALEICQESLSQLQEIEPCPNGGIIICYGLIGDIYYAENKYDDAEIFYSTAFEIAKKFLFIDDRRLIICIDALATTYQKQDNDDNNRSIKFCQEQLELYIKDLSENHISIAHILMILGKISNKIDYYEKALTIFERNISQDYASTANCIILLAKYYDEKKMYEDALLFNMRAYEIQRQIYPSNHSLIVKSEDMRNCIERNLKKKLNV